MCVLYVEMLCASRFGLGWAHNVFIVACHMFMHFSCICTILFFFWYWFCLVLLYVSLSLSLSLFQMVCAWLPSAKLLRPRTLFILGHLLPLTLPPFTFNSMMIKPVRTFRKTFLDVAFIWNARSFFWTSLILIYPLSFTVGVRSSFVTSRSVVLSWSYRSFTPICVDLILPYLAFSFLFEVCVQYSLLSLSPMCYMSQGYHILITLAVLICGLCLMTNSLVSLL